MPNCILEQYLTNRRYALEFKYLKSRRKYGLTCLEQILKEGHRGWIQ